MDVKGIYDAQISVLGSLLIDADVIAGELMSKVSADDFTGIYRKVFEASKRLFQAMKPIDPVTVLDELGGGEQYSKLILEIMDITPTSVNWSTYADIMHEDAQLRRLKEAAAKITEATTYEGARTATQQAAELLADRPKLRCVSFSQGLSEFISRHESKEPPKYIKWGIEPLDKSLYIEPGDLVVLGGYPSAGKTILATQFAYQMALKGSRVGVFSLETRDRKIYDRLMSPVLKVPFEYIKDRKLNQDHLATAYELGRVADSVEMDVIDAVGMSVFDIQAIALSRQYDVIFIDYLQLLRSEGKDRFEKVTNISLDLHTMAGRTGITVVALSQLSRRNKADKNKPPTMADLRESGQLEQDADVVMLLYLDDEDLPDGDRLLRIAKNKEGERGFMRLGFYSKHISLYFKGGLRTTQYRQNPMRFKVLPDDEPTPFDQLTIGKCVE